MRRRLVLMAAATTSMVVVAFVVPLALAVQTIAANEALNEAGTEARALAPAIATVKDPQVVSDLVRTASATSIGRLTVFMPDGVVLGAAGPADPEVILARSGRSFTTWTPDGADVLVPVLIPESGIAVIEVVVLNSRLRRGVTASWTILAAAALGLVLLAVFVADRIARDVVVPTRALALAAERVAGGQLQTRVAPAGPREVVEVGRAFNLLVGRINELLSAEREAAADLSHRLRTPLTALRLDVDRLPQDPAAKRIDADVRAVERAVNDVIRELRESTRDGVRPSADLVATVRTRMAFWMELAREQGRRFEVSLPPSSRFVDLARDEIEAIVDVLVGNIFAHTSESTAFRVSIDSPGGQARMTVEDDGPGFPPAMVARGASGEGSTGLGLDIARRAAESAGGSLAISTRPDGGARVEVRLPAARSVSRLRFEGLATV